MSKRKQIFAVIMSGLVFCGSLLVLIWNSPQMRHSFWFGPLIVLFLMSLSFLLMFGLHWAESAFSFSRKRDILFLLTSLAVTYVRQVVQYSRYTWNTIWQFLTFWLAHVVGLFLFVFITIACIKWSQKFFGGNREGEPEQIDNLVVHVLLVVLVASLVIFGLAHLRPYAEGFDDYLDY